MAAAMADPSIAKFVTGDAEEGHLRAGAAAERRGVTLRVSPMSDELRDQLQEVVGRAYTIERELGGGGMSRVFVASERRLGPAGRRQGAARPSSPRRCPPSGSSARSSSSASLQQAHIVPVSPPASSTACRTTPCRSSRASRLRARLARRTALPVDDGGRHPARRREGARLRARARRRAPRHQARQHPALRRHRPSSPTSASRRRSPRRRSGPRAQRSRSSAPPSARRPTWRPSRRPATRTPTIARTSTRSGAWPTSCSRAIRLFMGSRRTS